MASCSGAALAKRKRYVFVGEQSMASTSGAARARKKPDVFVNFRGEDTRHNFIGHLRAAMERNGIFAYTDQELRGGEEIAPTLSDMISESQVSVVVFSPNYADSRWCLDELVQIMQIRRENGQTVLPVFLQGVKATHVRHQTGSFGEGFKKLVARCPMLHPFVCKEEIWREALEQAANLSSGAFDHSSEEVIIKLLVNDILSTLGKMSSSDYDEGFFGEKCVRKFESIMFSQEEKSSIGIWGMGGSGKTTLAQKIRDRNSNNFHGVCFIENVGEHVEKGQANLLQKEVLYQLLGSYISNEPPCAIYNSHTIFRLSRKPVLVILDDINDASQIKAVIGDWKNYGTGSKMITTSRDKQVLKNECDTIYEVKTMDNRDSLQLLKYHMFKQRQPSPEQMGLLNHTIKYAQGLPLALVVLGRSLYDKDITIWKSELAKLNEFPTIGIINVLRSSFDRLDEPVKKLFLDIACLLHSWIGYDWKYYAFAACGFCPISSIDHLIDKALITVNSFGELRMHDLLRQLGNEIGKESRLWRSKEIADVLLNDVDSSRKKKIEVISSSKWPEAKRMNLKSDVFKKMPGLRILRLVSYCGKNILLPEGLAYLPNELRWLEWDGYPCPSLLSGFVLKNLVGLCLRYSKLIELWSGKAWLPNLKCIDISYSSMLVKLPDLSGSLKLVELDASHCDKLEEIPDSVKHLEELKHLNVHNAYKLTKCSELSQLTKLEDLCFNCCSSITKLPQLPPNLTSLSCSNCKELHSLPSNIGELKCLTRLSIEGCWNLLSLPTSVGDLQSLVELDANRSGLNCLPKEIKHLTNLKQLYLSQTKLDSLPKEIKHLANLQQLDLSHTNLKSLPEEIKHLTNLTTLCLSCTKLKSLPDDIRHLVQLQGLYLSHTDLKILPEGIRHLASLVTLDLFGIDLESLPKGIMQLAKLKSLYLPPTLLKRLRGDINYRAILKERPWHDSLEILHYGTSNSSMVLQPYSQFNLY